jgi:hypothetical protein
MSCRRFEHDLALAIGGDLPARRLRRLETHIATCASCRTLAARLREDHAALAALAAEAPDLAELNALRGSVLVQVRSRRSASVPAAGGRPVVARLATVGAAAVLLIAVLAVVAVRRSVPPAATGRPMAVREPVAATPAPLVAAESLPRPEAIRPERPTAPPVRRPARPAVRQATAPAPPATAEPLVIKVLTDDPNVVIYWLADSQKG